MQSQPMHRSLGDRCTYFFRIVKERTAYRSKDQMEAAGFHMVSCGFPGGGERDRTDDLLLAKQALSHLSYTPPLRLGGSGWVRTTDPRLIKTVL